ncbi:hypothetical protein HYH02_000108 [Chlamydomonas schloesseri]|uniref:Protein kinase domain-containing protein n=1 Tax=Chlamydomonas schloesseri TaxID=2026947 RepID=A0A835WML5_9CHLO|nr:hypothetical protein HYH02_000108 [Chlamydomonas schloesseri]|eukprot:KAG2450004.1 hypothetical protein HYH02_000108 [Chlamydomonas schloesseri]
MGNVCGGASSGAVDAPAGGADGKYSHGPLLAARAKAAKDFDSCKKDEFAKKFEMRKLLGKGEYSKVVECINMVDHKRYAVKILEKANTEREAVINEVAVTRMLAGFSHTVRVHEVLEDRLNYYLVLELCKGGELFDRILAKGHYSEREAAAVMRVLLDFTEHAHREGIIHRDLKPHNILLLNEVTDDRVIESPIRIIDFGTSDYCADGERLTHSVGTPHYIAPEVLKEDYDKTADIWSLGVNLYILLSGAMPFGGSSPEAITKMVAAGKYSLESAVWKGISNEAKDMLAAMLQMDPARRATIQQLKNHPWFAVAEGRAAGAAGSGGAGAANGKVAANGKGDSATDGGSVTQSDSSEHDEGAARGAAATPATPTAPAESVDHPKAADEALAPQAVQVGVSA